jgi:hypothetical protein
MKEEHPQVREQKNRKMLLIRFSTFRRVQTRHFVLILFHCGPPSAS